MIQAASEAKAAQEAERKAAKEQREEDDRQKRRDRQSLLDDHALPTLREFVRDLAAAGIPARVEANGEFQPISFVHIGRMDPPGARSAHIRVVPGDGELSVSSYGGGQERNWRAIPDNARDVLAEACEDALNRWHGIKGYR